MSLFFFLLLLVKKKKLSIHSRKCLFKFLAKLCSNRPPQQTPFLSFLWFSTALDWESDLEAVVWWSIIAEAAGWPMGAGIGGYRDASDTWRHLWLGCCLAGRRTNPVCCEDSDYLHTSHFLSRWCRHLGRSSETSEEKGNYWWGHEISVWNIITE